MGIFIDYGNKRIEGLPYWCTEYMEMMKQGTIVETHISSKYGEDSGVICTMMSVDESFNRLSYLAKTENNDTTTTFCIDVWNRI